MTDPGGVALIVNPVKSRASEAVARVCAACLQQGRQAPMVLETTPAAPGADQARAALAAGVTAVIAAGGDGTVREVASVLAGTGTPLGILPLGTGNLLARNLGLRPGDLALHVSIALEGKDRAIDVARADLRQAGGESSHIFLVMAGLGLDARVVDATRDRLKRRLGWLAYGEASLRHLLHCSQRVTVQVDDQPEETRNVQTVLIGNCGLVPGGVRVFPQARPDNGVLEVVIAAPLTPLGWLPIAGSVLSGNRLGVATLQHRTAQVIEVRPASPTRMQLDGDVFPGVERARIHIEAGALRVRTVPPVPSQPGFPWRQHSP